MVKIREIKCQSAIGKCGFPSGGWSINPYIGCEHACVYCYARFMKRFTGHTEPWGEFVDIKTNIADVLEKQIQSPKYQKGSIYIGTVTDPYQPIEKKYQITRQILKVLKKKNLAVEILTKSDLVLRDLDLLGVMKNTSVNITINSMDEKWQRFIEPHSSMVKDRLRAIYKLNKKKIPVKIMIGPYWPFFTDIDKLFKELGKLKINYVFSESFNTTGSNWIGVENILSKHYPGLLPKMKNIMFDQEKFNIFYNQAKQKLKKLAKKYKIPISIYFARGHASKLKN